MNRVLIVLISFTIVSKVTVAQNTDVGNWFIYFGNQAVNKKFNWHNEVQYRNYNVVGDLQQLLLRTGIGYNLTENNNNILLGYGYIQSKNYVPNKIEKITTHEHRVFQQFINRQNIGKVFLQHRYRVEERFLKNDFQMRFRYFLAVNIPFGKKIMAPQTLYASAYNEIFVNAQNNYFDRNRLYGGLGYVFNRFIKAEVGFMAQTQQMRNRNQFQIILFNNLPFKNPQ